MLMLAGLSCRMSTQLASEVGAFGIEPGDLVDMMAGMRVSLDTDIGEPLSNTSVWLKGGGGGGVQSLQERPKEARAFPSGDAGADGSRWITLVRGSREPLRSISMLLWGVAG